MNMQSVNGINHGATASHRYSLTLNRTLKMFLGHPVERQNSIEFYLQRRDFKAIFTVENGELRHRESTSKIAL